MQKYIPLGSSSGTQGRHRTSSNNLGIYLKRLFQFPQMDFEMATWQMIYLIISPKKVFRTVYYQKQTKNQWSRDDPAFVVLLSLCLSISAIAYGLAFSVFTISGLIKTVFYMIIIEFLTTGLVIASVCW
jgi:hypothetical protein